MEAAVRALRAAHGVPTGLQCEILRAVSFCLRQSPWIRPEAVESAVTALLDLPEVRNPYAFLMSVLPGRHLRASEDALEKESAERRKG